MSLLRQIGKKQMEILAAWAPSAATFGGAASLGVLYFTDWKLVLQYLPFYNTKFKEDK